MSIAAPPLGAQDTAGTTEQRGYWNDAYFDALAEIHRSCEGHGLDAISVALHWLIHHSQLNAERNDGIIIGASSLEHLRHNLTAVTEGPLPTEVLVAIDDAALKAQPKWPPYFMDRAPPNLIVSQKYFKHGH